MIGIILGTYLLVIIISQKEFFDPIGNIMSDPDAFHISGITF